jgi:hypothetical protein
MSYYAMQGMGAFGAVTVEEVNHLVENFDWSKHCGSQSCVNQGILLMQQALEKLGYATGGVDGRWGTNTIKAYQAFAAARNLPYPPTPTGIKILISQGFNLPIAPGGDVTPEELGQKAAEKAPEKASMAVPLAIGGVLLLAGVAIFAAKKKPTAARPNGRPSGKGKACPSCYAACSRGSRRCRHCGHSFR